MVKWLSQHWSDPVPSRWLYAGGWLAILCACILRAGIGAGGARQCTADLFNFFDGGWRVLHGQVPYKNFFTDMGPFIHLLTALGMRLAHGRAEGLGYGQAILGLSFGIWSWTLTGQRLQPILRVLFCVSVVLLSMSPVVLGDPPNVTSHAGFYNRNGTALMALVIVEATCRRKEETKRSRFLGGFSSGCAVALALFFKVTYCPGGSFLVLALIPCVPQSRARWVGLASGAVATVFPFWLLMGGTFMPMIKVLSLLAGAKHVAIGGAVFDAGIFYVLPVAVFALMLAALRWQDGARAEVGEIVIALVAVSAAGLFFQMTNDPRMAMPLNPILAIVLAQRLAQAGNKEAGADARSAAAIRVLLVAWMMVVAGGSLAADGASLLYALHNKSQIERTPGTSFHAAVLSGASSAQIPYVAMVNEGIDLLRPHLRPGDTVGTLDFTNPFSYSLGLPPQEGGTSSALAVGFNFSDRSKPSAEYMMGTVTVMMVTQYFAGGEFSRAYGPYLETHFHLEAQSARWRLYRRN